MDKSLFKPGVFFKILDRPEILRVGSLQDDPELETYLILRSGKEIGSATMNDNYFLLQIELSKGDVVESINEVIFYVNITEVDFIEPNGLSKIEFKRDSGNISYFSEADGPLIEAIRSKLSPAERMRLFYIDPIEALKYGQSYYDSLTDKLTKIYKFRNKFKFKETGEKIQIDEYLEIEYMEDITLKKLITKVKNKKVGLNEIDNILVQMKTDLFIPDQLYDVFN